jgi:hypothetical protein
MRAKLRLGLLGRTKDETQLVPTERCASYTGCGLAALVTSVQIPLFAPLCKIGVPSPQKLRQIRGHELIAGSR